MTDIVITGTFTIVFNTGLMAFYYYTGMKKLILISVLMFVTYNITAPTIDFRLWATRYPAIQKEADRLLKELAFSRFIDDLGYRESENNWLSINRIGCFGEWQFSESTLHFLGYRNITLSRFKADPEIFPAELQRKALKSLIRVNLALLRDYQHLIGDSIGNVLITKSGMIAAAHLGGAGSVRKFFESKGSINRKDVLGTSIVNYMNRFSKYDLD